MRRFIVSSLKNLDNLSALSIRLVKLTGKHPSPVHPKHLINEQLWFDKYLKKTDRILDLGSSSGQTSIKISKRVREIVGIEISDHLIDIAKKDSSILKNIRFIKHDLNKKLPFKDKEFDKIICSDVLEHVERRDDLLKEIKRILKKKGLVFLATDNPDTSWKKLQKSVGLNYYADPGHTYEYPREEILKKLEESGFRVLVIDQVTYDTPFKGLIDITGGISMNLYKKMRKWREDMVKKYPEETVGFRIVGQKL